MCSYTSWFMSFDLDSAYRASIFLKSRDPTKNARLKGRRGRSLPKPSFPTSKISPEIISQQVASIVLVRCTSEGVVPATYYRPLELQAVAVAFLKQQSRKLRRE